MQTNKENRLPRPEEVSGEGLSTDLFGTRAFYAVKRAIIADRARIAVRIEQLMALAGSGTSTEVVESAFNHLLDELGYPK
jgi:hypothetical protein